MRILKYIFVLILLFTSFLTAKERKKVTKEFNVSPQQKIEINTKGGMDIDVIAWDEPKIRFELKISISSSDNDYEKEFIKEFDVVEYRDEDYLEIEITYPKENDGWSFWDIFKGKFNFYIDRSIEGKIFLPKSNPVASNFRYGNITLDGMEGEFILDGRSNNILLQNCKNLRIINNHYGETKIYNSGGNLDLQNRSSNIVIRDFNGPVKVDGQYCDINLKNINGSVDIDSRSADEIIVTNVKGDCEVDADYSNVFVYDVQGFAGVKNRSGSISIIGAESFSIIAPYTSCIVKDITGEGIQKKYECSLRSESFFAENIKGDLFIKDNYSDFEFVDIYGNIEIESRSGKIVGKNIQGNWKSETQYCYINLKNLSASKIEIKNRSEPVLLETTAVPETVTIKNNYGEVILMMPEGFEGKVELFANHGDIESNLPLRFKSMGSSTAGLGNIGNGTGIIFIENKSETIKIEETNIANK